MRLVIPGTLPGLNDYTKACRAHRMAGAKMKSQAEELVTSCLYGVKPVSGRVNVAFRWVEPTRRRDPDNIRFAAKFILDALVESGIIEGDSQRFIASLTDEYELDKADPRIEVEIVQESA